MNRTKIQWTDITWNMVWGCYGKCTYCYAKTLAKRFARQVASKNPNIDLIDLEHFRPTLVNSIDHVFPVKPVKIFANSMSDIAFWDPKWLTALIRIIKDNPQHTFQLLTKFPVQLRQEMDYWHMQFPSNVWLGLTATTQASLDHFYYMTGIKAGKYFISVEPIHGEIDISQDFIPNKFDINKGYTKFVEELDWIIVGVETPRTTKSEGTEAYIQKLIKQAQYYRIPIFVKTIMAAGKIWKNELPVHPFNYNIRQFPE